MTIVFIAEKPSVAQDLAIALSPSHTKKNGYIEGSNNHLYTWTFGHLVQVKPPGSLNPDWAEWKWDTLPMIPRDIKLEPIGEREKNQLKVISNLVHNPSCKMIYNCCDAGLEGENILQFVSIFLKFNNKPMKRLWTSSIQPQALKKAFENAKDSKEYQGLRNAGLARTISDWIVGLNGTRAISLATGNNNNVNANSSENNNALNNYSTLQVGRVMTPVLALVYDRDIERENFKKLKYYPITATFNQNGQVYLGAWQGEKINDRALAESIQKTIDKQQGLVDKVVDTDKSTPPPTLMNLTAASKEANSKFGLNGKDTLRHLQNLYLKHYITYPRTSGRAVTPDEIPLMHASYGILAQQYPHLAKNGVLERVNESNIRVVNPKLIEDHHALLPEPVVATDLEGDEKKVYEMIVERFFLQFQDHFKYKQRDVLTTVQGNTFISRYKEVKDEGWHAILAQPEEDENEEDEIFNGFPNILQGQASFVMNSELSEKETAPPAAYNDGTLMIMMENISSRVTDSELKVALKDCGIGTSATRADTIAKLVKIGYLSYEKKALTTTKKGRTIIEVLRGTNLGLLTSPEMTAKWEKELENIKNGKNPQAFNQGIYQFIHKLVDELKNTHIENDSLYEFVAECPKCKKGIISSPKQYYCSGKKDNQCDFFIWKTQYNKSISKTMLTQLIKKGITNKLTFKSKNGQEYKAKLKLNSTNKDGRLEIEYEN